MEDFLRNNQSDPDQHVTLNAPVSLRMNNRTHCKAKRKKDQDGKGHCSKSDSVGFLWEKLVAVGQMEQVQTSRGNLTL